MMSISLASRSLTRFIKKLEMTMKLGFGKLNQLFNNVCLMNRFLVFLHSRHKKIVNFVIKLQEVLILGVRNGIGVLRLGP